MNKQHYPIFIIPEQYFLYFSGNPYPDNFVKTVPLEPTYEVYKESKFNGCLAALMPIAFICIGIGVFAFITEKTSSEDVIGFFICVLIFLIWVVANDNSKNVKKEMDLRNQIKRDSFLTEKVQYEKDLKEFKELKLIQADRTKNIQYRRNKLIELLKNTSKANIQYIGRKGRTEEFFTEYLKRFFKERILTSLIIERFKNANPYQADIIFHHKELNVWIDIEIDETYDFVEKKPIHYIDEYDSHIDFERNQYFLKHGWFVVRFTENQVISNPLSCCKFLSDQLRKYFPIKEYYNLFYNVKELECENCWTYKEASERADNNSRNS